MSELKSYQMYINGEWVDAKDGKTFESVNPSTGKSWAIIPEAGETDVDAAVQSAYRAFSDGPWPKMTATERGKLLRRLADVLAEHSETLGHSETVDTGKLFQETRWQARYISDFFHYYAGLADKVQGDTLPIDKTQHVDDDSARTPRRGCCGCTLEFAALSRGRQNRTSLGCRQHRCAQSL